jgi:hypothetical protein
MPKSHSQSQLALMTVPNYRNNSPSRAMTSMEGYATNTIPTKDIIAKVKADLTKKREREK